MLTHIVIFRRKPGLERDDTVERRFFEQLDSLSQSIPFIRHWRLSTNELDRPTSWGYVLESRFDDIAALDEYLTHPAHIAVVGALRHYFEWAACDYTE